LKTNAQRKRQNVHNNEKQKFDKTVGLSNAAKVSTLYQVKIMSLQPTANGLRHAREEGV
jgi:hypothetical protein